MDIFFKIYLKNIKQNRLPSWHTMYLAAREGRRRSNFQDILEKALDKIDIFSIIYTLKGTPDNMDLFPRFTSKSTRDNIRQASLISYKNFAHFRARAFH